MSVRLSTSFHTTRDQSSFCISVFSVRGGALLGLRSVHKVAMSRLS